MRESTYPLLEHGLVFFLIIVDVYVRIPGIKSNRYNELKL